MRDLAIVFVHLIVTLARVARPVWANVVIKGPRLLRRNLALHCKRLNELRLCHARMVKIFELLDSKSLSAFDAVRGRSAELDRYITSQICR